MSKKQKNKKSSVVKNTEIIKDNTEVIKETGLKTYYQDRQKRTWEALFYSHQRIDTLLITISGASIYLCFETIKYKNDNHFLYDLILIKFAAFLFLASIILNFCSQWVGTKIHSEDYMISERNINCDNGLDDKDLEEISKSEKKIYCYDKAHKILGILSFVSMSLGLLLLIIFFSLTF